MEFMKCKQFCQTGKHFIVSIPKKKKKKDTSASSNDLQGTGNALLVE